MDFSVVIAASAAVNRLIEAVKPFVRKWNVSIEIQDGVLVVLQMLAGIALALMGNLNLFVGLPSVTPGIAVLLTGAVLGLGSDVINVVVDFLYGWKNNVTAPTAATESASADISIDVKGGTA